MSNSITSFQPYKVTQPEWSSHAVIYQVNTRQFSNEGKFAGVTEQLPRIKSLGADIIWLMPIHPIGEVERKGTLGSPYAVKDYMQINPEFGTADDLHTLIKTAHDLSMKVIIDWVPNHSAWDNPLVEKHPEWYAKDYKGDFRPSPWWDWSDIIEFDYTQVGLRNYMIEAMCYWVKEFDIDGFRHDVAGYVPNDFWQQARCELDAIKPVFMLAEWESRDMHERAFNMTYAWTWNETMHEIAMGKRSLDSLRKYYSWNERSWPQEAYRMTFVSNHDKNAWDGTQYEQFGDALEASIVLSVIGEGMPLIHNGQEAGETKRLAFFERDPIEWQEHEIGELYRDLIALKKSKAVLGNGEYGARMIQVPNSAMNKVFSFVRHNTDEKVFVVINFSNESVSTGFYETLFEDDYIDFTTGQHHTFSANTQLTLGPWQYKIFIKR